MWKVMNQKPISQRRRRGQSGNTLIESALFFPVIIYMCFGVVDYSRLFAKLTQVESAARAGADVAMYTPSNYNTSTGPSAAALQAIKDAASADPGTGLPVNPTVTMQYTCTNADGTDGTIQSTYQSSCANGQRIYVYVATSTPSGSVVNYPLMMYPATVYGQATVRVGGQ
jgi:Flp pilus assembly protein TadG